MNDLISILIPTMGRPERLRDTVKSIYDTASRPSAVEVLVRVDWADAARPEYVKVVAEMWGACRTFYPEGQTSYGKGIEYLRKKARGDVFFAGSDDTIFRTKGWDARVRAALVKYQDGLAILYANNGQDREKAEHFFATRKWVDTLGYLVRTEFRHFCVDQWVEELAKGVGRLEFLRDVVVEHCHKKYAKAPDDATYQMVRGKTGTSDADNALFAQLADVRRDDLARLRQAVVREHCQRYGVDT